MLNIFHTSYSHGRHLTLFENGKKSENLSMWIFYYIDLKTVGIDYTNPSTF